ncbi:MAG: LutC/YkgG family protein [Cellulomonas sp.]
MTDARAEMLARLDAALGSAATERTATERTAPENTATVTGGGPVPDVDRDYLGADSTWETATTGAALLALLTERIVDYRATVTRVTPDEVADVVARLLVGARRVVAPHGLDRSWLEVAAAAGADVVWDGPSQVLSVRELDAVDAVVTGSRLAIAETGTIVLDAAADQGRRALSLVPDHHICVVRTDDVVRGVPAAMTRLDVTRPLTWISGPSATSDIELERVEGVHGPRRLDVVLVG